MVQLNNEFFEEFERNIEEKEKEGHSESCQICKDNFDKDKKILDKIIYLRNRINENSGDPTAFRTGLIIMFTLEMVSFLESVKKSSGKFDKFTVHNLEVLLRVLDEVSKDILERNYDKTHGTEKL